MAPKRSSVHKYFKYNKNEDISTCEVESCPKKLVKHCHAGNLKKHLEVYHKDIFNEIKSELNSKEGSSTSKEGRIPRPIQKTTKISNFCSSRPKIKNINVKIDIDEFKDGLVELVTNNGRPFSAVEDSGLQKMLEPLIKAVNDQMIKFSINRKNIVDFVADKAKTVAAHIKAEVRGKLLSLKLDSATRLNKSFLGKK